MIIMPKKISMMGIKSLAEACSPFCKSLCFFSFQRSLDCLAKKRGSSPAPFPILCIKALVNLIISGELVALPNLAMASLSAWPFRISSLASRIRA